MRVPFAIALLLVGCVDDDDDSAEPTPWPEPTSPLSGTVHPPCDEPAEAPGGFADGLAESGVDFVHRSDDAFLTDPDDYTMPLAESVAAGVVAADLDGDGHTDLFFPQTVGANAIFWGSGGGGFVRGVGTGVELPEEIDASASAADYDGDGLLDLAVAGFGAFHLFRNRGDRTFEDVTAAVGIVSGGGWPGTPAWGDFDRDGDLDLYEGRHAGAANEDIGLLETIPDALWRNDGERFVDVHDQFAIEDDGAWLHGAFRDLDGDGDLDLVHVNDFGDIGPNSFLWENGGADGEGWVWRERLASSGIGSLAAPMGVAIRDLDGDGRLDLVYSDIGRLSSFRGVGAFEFVDTSAVWLGALDHGDHDASWSVVDIDLDGDGSPSIFVAYGPLPAEPGSPEWAPNQRDRLLEPADGAWRDVADAFPSPPTGNSRGVAQGDLNADGVPDLVVGRVREAPSILLGRCTAAHRLVVDLRDDRAANRFAIGARVTVDAEGLGTQVQEVVAGGRGTYSGSGPDLFFGLGDAQEATVTIRWPDGAEERFVGVAAHQRIVVTRGGAT